MDPDEEALPLGVPVGERWDVDLVTVTSLDICCVSVIDGVASVGVGQSIFDALCVSVAASVCVNDALTLCVGGDSETFLDVTVDVSESELLIVARSRERESDVVTDSWCDSDCFVRESDGVSDEVFR